MSECGGEIWQFAYTAISARVQTPRLRTMAVPAICGLLRAPPTDQICDASARWTIGPEAARARDRVRRQVYRPVNKTLSGALAGRIDLILG